MTKGGVAGAWCPKEVLEHIEHLRFTIYEKTNRIPTKSEILLNALKYCFKQEEEFMKEWE